MDTTVPGLNTADCNGREDQPLSTGVGLITFTRVTKTVEPMFGRLRPVVCCQSAVFSKAKSPPTILLVGQVSGNHRRKLYRVQANDAHQASRPQSD